MAASFGPMLTRRSLLSSTALAILGAAALPLTACGASSGASNGAASDAAKRTFVDAAKGAHAGKATGAPWVSANLAQNLTSSFETDDSEDFYANANIDWLAEQKVPEMTHGYHPAIDDAEYEVRCRLRTLLGATTNSGKDVETDQAQQAAINFYSLLTRWNDRDKSGYRGLEIALNEVDMQSSLEDLITYLLSPGRLTWLAPFLDIVVVRNPTNPKKFIITPRAMCFDTHKSAAATLETDEAAMIREAKWTEEVEWLLLQTPYAERAHELTTASLAFQKELAKAVVAAPKPKDSQRIVSMAEFDKLLGGYPIEVLNFCYSLDEAKEVLLSNSCEQYCTVIGNFIDEKYLPGIKAQIMCALTHAGYDYLTKEAFEHIHGEVSKDTTEDLAVTEILSVLRNPVTNLYLKSYTDEEAKGALEELVEQVRDGLKETIEANEWMGAKTKAECTKKLEGVRVVCMYPELEVDDTFYPEIDRFRDGGYVWDAKRQAEIYKRDYAIAHLLDDVPDEYMVDAQTMTAKYAPTYLDARVVYDQAGVLQLGAGLVCGVFDASQTAEERLARAGSLIAHELTHSFDARGWMRDVNGLGKQLYEDADRTKLADLTAVVATWFDEQCQPLGEPLENLGERVKIEAIAEMCALKALMKVAEGESGFEHKKFFEEYARFNADIQEEELFVETINTSVAPLAATRVNLALGALEEFRDAYHVKDDDLMATAFTEKLSVF